VSVSISEPSVVPRVESRAVTTGEVIDTFEAMDGVRIAGLLARLVVVAQREAQAARAGS
jgi:hypothetical protein